jgi:DNA-binding transcriptional regulator YiaG
MNNWEFSMSFRIWLKHVRMEANHKRQYLADLIGCTLGEVEKWESGAALPDAHQFILLVRVYGRPDFIGPELDKSLSLDEGN